MPHTPGPWRISRNEDSATYVIRTKYIVVANAGSTHDDYRLANARLIAAAPELLEALVKAEAFYKEMLDATGGCDHSVGICCCRDARELKELQALLKRVE